VTNLPKSLTPLICEVCNKKVTTEKELDNELARGHSFDNKKLEQFLNDLEDGYVTKEKVEFT